MTREVTKADVERWRSSPAKPKLLHEGDEVVHQVLLDDLPIVPDGDGVEVDLERLDSGRDLAAVPALQRPVMVPVSRATEHVYSPDAKKIRRISIWVAGSRAFVDERLALFRRRCVTQAADPGPSSRSTSSSISAERASAKPRSVAMTRKPHFSRTRRDATLSEATRAWRGRDRSTARNALRAAVAIPLPQ